MNISIMRAKYKLQLAGLADGTSDADIDTLMDRAYQFTLPTRIPGEMYEGGWRAQTAASTDTVAYNTEVMHLDSDYAAIGNATLTIDEQPLRVWTDESLFFLRWTREDITADRAKPTDVLIRGREVIFRPWPDKIYWAYFTGKIAPDSGVPGPAGIADDNHAMAIVLLAALETAQDNQLDMLEAKLNKRLPIYVDPLIENSLGRAHNRRYVRTF